ncbi:MAG: hypothetical protein WCS73_12680 [Lentisphaeria bacterium]
MKFIHNVLVAALLLTGSSIVFAQEAPTADAKAPAAIETKDVPVAAECGCECAAFKPEFNLTIDAATDYACDGFIINPDPVTSIDFSMAIKNFYVGVWGQYDWTNYQDESMGYDNSRKNNFEEIDYYAGYFYTIPDGAGFTDLTIDAGFAYFDYPTVSHDNWGNDHNEEWALKFQLGNMLDSEIQTLTAAAELDYDTECDYGYGQFDLNYSRELCEKTTLQVGTSLFWGTPRKMQAQADDNDLGWGIRSIVCEIGVDYAVSEDMTITPYIGASYLPQDNVRQYTRSNDDVDSNTWGGLKASYNF